MKLKLKAVLVLSALLAPGFSLAQTFTESAASLIGTIKTDVRSISWGDIDNDGDPDLLLQGAASTRRLYRNNHNGTGMNNFTNITSTFGPVANDTAGWSAAWADYDGDGYVDVFLGEANTGTARGDLFHNDGGTSFVNVSATTINDPGFHQNVAWADIDNDGDLDLIIGMEGPEEHEVYLQNADGTFTQSGATVGIQVPYGTKSYGMAIGDTDGDGDLEIYISTCRGGGDIRNNFFQNELKETGTLHFTDIADQNGTQYMDNAYHAEFVDFDDDGDLDLLMIGADTNPSKIWRNDGGGKWTDVDTITGHPLFTQTGSDLNGGKAIDYDNDGDLDIFAQNHLADPVNIARVLYRNDGNWQFTEVTAEEGLDATNEGGYDSSFADYDLDGDMDLVCSAQSSNSLSYGVRFFVSNASTNGNHWLQVRLKAPAPNTRAVGAMLYAAIHAGTAKQRTLRRDMTTSAGTFAQNDLPVHFGLGDATKIDTLRIVWPDGKEQTMADVAVDQYLNVTEPTGGAGSDAWVIK